LSVLYFAISARIPIKFCNPLYRCAMNSAIHCLYQIEPLNQLVLQRAPHYAGSIAQLYSDTIKDLEQAPKDVMYDPQFCSTKKGAVFDAITTIFKDLMQDPISQKKIDDFFDIRFKDFMLTKQQENLPDAYIYTFPNQENNLYKNLQFMKSVVYKPFILAKTSEYCLLNIITLKLIAGKPVISYEPCVIDSLELDLSAFFEPVVQPNTHVYTLFAFTMHNKNHATAYVQDQDTKKWYFMNDYPKSERIEKTEAQITAILHAGIASEGISSWTANLIPDMLFYKRVEDVPTHMQHDRLEQLAASLHELQASL